MCQVLLACYLFSVPVPFFVDLPLIPNSVITRELWLILFSLSFPCRSKSTLWQIGLTLQYGVLDNMDNITCVFLQCYYGLYELCQFVVYWLLRGCTFIEMC
jgi:hypothetical protein